MGAKLFLVSSILIWYWNSNNRWKNFILIPFAFYFYQFSGIVFADFPSYPSKEFDLYSIVLSVLISIILFYFKPENLFLITSNIFSDRIKHNYLFNLERKISIESKKNHLSEMTYLENIVSISEGLRKEQIYVDNEEINMSKKYWGIKILLIILPIFTYAYKIVDPSVKFIDFGLFTLGSFGYSYVYIFLWAIVSKFIILTLLIIWFLTTNSWYKYTILSPVLFTSYQILEVFLPAGVDEIAVLDAFTVLLPFAFLLVYSSYKLKYLSLNLTLQDVLEKEINAILKEVKERNSKQVKVKLEKLVANQSQYTAQEYLEELMKLQNISKISVYERRD
uniref:hypothetical protein n=1 Tax=Zhouia sp. PK063 TaxID=3373602 RepID=UPI0037DD76D3